MSVLNKILVGWSSLKSGYEYLIFCRLCETAARLLAPIEEIGDWYENKRT